MNSFKYKGYYCSEATKFFGNSIISEERSGCAAVGFFIKLKDGKTHLIAKNDVFEKDENEQFSLLTQMDSSNTEELNQSVWEKYGPGFENCSKFVLYYLFMALFALGYFGFVGLYFRAFPIFIFEFLDWASALGIFTFLYIKMADTLKFMRKLLRLDEKDNN